MISVILSSLPQDRLTALSLTKPTDPIDVISGSANLDG
jgi:hypothetical protein